MKDIEKQVKAYRNKVERSAQTIGFESIMRNIRDSIKNSEELDQKTKDTALEALDVPINDFVQDSVDRRMAYKERSPGMQMRFFIAGILGKAAVERVENKEQSAALLEFSKEILVDSAS